jgi:hypothetical protein
MRIYTREKVVRRIERRSFPISSVLNRCFYRRSRNAVSLNYFAGKSDDAVANKGVKTFPFLSKLIGCYARYVTVYAEFASQESNGVRIVLLPDFL